MNSGRALTQRVERALWGSSTSTGSIASGVALRALRVAVLVVRDLALGQLTLRAMSLVYTTLLSIVPLLALSFSVLKGFGVYNQIQPMLLGFLEPLGEKSEEVTLRIVQFIENTNVGVLGAVGLALLLYTAVSLMQKIEESLNFLWHVARARAFAERFSRYISALLVGPILVFSAIGMTATVTSIDAIQGLLAIDALGRVAVVLGRLAPYLFVIAAFAFVYLFIPNTRVGFVAALIGGAVGGIAWQTAGWAFATFVASSGKYAAIYSGFAILILFMIWVYLSWLILLLGASVAFYWQHPEYAFAKAGEPELSNRMRERLAVSAMTAIARPFVQGAPAPTIGSLSRSLGVPAHALGTVIDALERRGLLTLTAADPPALLPARDPSLIAVAQIVGVVRATGERRFVGPGSVASDEAADDVLALVESALESALEGMTLKDLALREASPAGDKKGT
ncbi:MAG: YihY family inner membrane protein [Burkholderiaceae bacterium]|nr:YihY family inner membrane protein [Burkholderiaceae bacterium]